MCLAAPLTCHQICVSVWNEWDLNETLCGPLDKSDAARGVTRTVHTSSTIRVDGDTRCEGLYSVVIICVDGSTYCSTHGKRTTRIVSSGTRRKRRNDNKSTMQSRYSRFWRSPSPHRLGWSGPTPTSTFPYGAVHHPLPFHSFVIA
jgi:hypothetical protein